MGFVSAFARRALMSCFRGIDVFRLRTILGEMTASGSGLAPWSAFGEVAPYEASESDMTAADTVKMILLFIVHDLLSLTRHCQSTRSSSKPLHPPVEAGTAGTRSVEYIEGVRI
jgi:hypothetical protein